jgi:hypothetical protein
MDPHMSTPGTDRPSSNVPVQGTPRRLTWRHLAAVLAFSVITSAVLGWKMIANGPRVADVEHVRLVADAEHVVGVVQRQADALLAGDREGWLAPVADDLRAHFQQRYDALRALQVNRLVGLVTPDPTTVDDDPATVHTTVRYSYCVQLDPCPAERSESLDGYVYGVAPTNYFLDAVAWTRTAEGYKITNFRHGAKDGNPSDELPWITTELIAHAGPRVTVFALPSEDPNLVKLVSDEAEAAALNADPWATGPVPRRYVLYIAGRSEWTTWFGNPASWALAYTIPTSHSSQEVVLNGEIAANKPSAVRGALRHEFGHVTTLLGSEPFIAGMLGDRALWIEGIANLIAEDGSPVSDYRGLGTARKFLQSGQFAGDLDALQVQWSRGDTGPVYSLGYLTWRYIDDTYGRAKTIALATELFRTLGTTVDDAMRTALGTSWSEVEPACVAYIRNVAA